MSKKWKANIVLSKLADVAYDNAQARLFKTNDNVN